MSRIARRTSAAALNFSLRITVMNVFAPLLFIGMFLTLSGCSLVTVPVKIVGKVATTSIKLAGKAAGAGIDAMKKDDPAPKPDPEGE